MGGNTSLYCVGGDIIRGGGGHNYGHTGCGGGQGHGHTSVGGQGHGHTAVGGMGTWGQGHGCGLRSGSAKGCIVGN